MDNIIDPSILKLFEEEDEDETMHSAAEVEALQAALYHEIQDYNSSTSQAPSHSNTGTVNDQFQSGSQDGEMMMNLQNQQALQSAQQAKQSLPRRGPQDASGSVLQSPEKQSNDVPQHIPLHALMSNLLPQLDMLKAMQLDALCTKYLRNQITKAEFVLQVRKIAGQEELSIAINKYNSQTLSQPKNPRASSFTSGPHSSAQLQKLISNSPSNSVDRNALKPSIISPAEFPQAFYVNLLSSQKPSIISPAEFPQSFYPYLLSSKNPSVTSPAGFDVRKLQRKPSVGQKRQIEALGSSPSPPSKRHEIVPDQSIEQLNDVAAASGINLQEEVEQLLSGHKESSVSEAIRRVIHEEEERGILLKIPLQKKLAGIVAKKGLKNISDDVEQLLSRIVEERMRGLIHNLVKVSKQRADAENPMHPKQITSDVREKIIALNSKAKVEWEKKQIEVELQNLEEVFRLKPEGSGVDSDKEKDKGQVKSVKTNMEEDDKMMATAANVAAHAAVGGDDMMLRWQLMAKQARQQRERDIDAGFSYQAGTKDNQEARKRSLPSPLASTGEVGRSEVAPTISVEDLISVLKKDPKLSRSELLFRLYERGSYMDSLD